MSDYTLSMCDECGFQWEEGKTPDQSRNALKISPEGESTPFFLGINSMAKMLTNDQIIRDIVQYI